MNARIPLEERIKQLRAMLNEPRHSSKERIDNLEWALDQTLSMVGKLAEDANKQRECVENYTNSRRELWESLGDTERLNLIEEWSKHVGNVSGKLRQTLEAMAKGKDNETNR